MSLRRRIRRESVSHEVYLAKDALDIATEQEENVFLFIPNIIGYVRFITAAIAMYSMPHHPRYSTILYFTSCILDVADGMVARALGQTSKFGAVLDMVLDRCTTACLMCFLASAYPKYALLFQALITLDFSSHYMHMYSSLMTGSISHKLVKSDVSWILWMYYNSSVSHPTRAFSFSLTSVLKFTLFIFCLCNETFFACLYVMTAWKTPIGLSGSLVFSLLPDSVLGYAPKTAAHVSAFMASLTWPQLLAYVTFPICFAKQIVNVVQFWKASKILVGIDLAERFQKREADVRNEKAASLKK